MSGFMTGLKALFGGSAKLPSKPRPPQKTVLPPSARAALLKDAMAAHRAGRAYVRDVLEAQLDELRAKVPRPGQDPEGTERLLALARADGAVKKLMTHDLKRFLVLVGIRELLDEGAQGGKPARSISKR
jgi:hypothetical protein